jgi:excisionase family DNA binding protein
MVIKSPASPVSMLENSSNSTPSGLTPIAVSIREACAVLGIKRSTIYREIAARRIRAVKAGKRTLIPVTSLVGWLAALPESGSVRTVGKPKR